MSKYVIGLPAYNEERNIGKLLEKIDQLKPILGDELFVAVVNDGSIDGTEAILKQYSSRLSYMSYFNHPQNLGLGCAMDTLLHYAAQNYVDQDILITFDADNTHNPNIVPLMIKKLLEEDLDIVIASRFTGDSRELGLSNIRKLYSRGAMLFCRTVFHIRNVRDYSCGYRAYRVGFLKKLLTEYGGEVVKSRGFECMVEILAKAGKIGVRAGEVPFILEYNLKEGKSKMDAKKTILGYMRLAFRVRRPKARIGI